MERIHRELNICVQGQGRKISKICQKFKFWIPDSEKKNVKRDTPSNDSDHLKSIHPEL